MDRFAAGQPVRLSEILDELAALACCAAAATWVVLQLPAVFAPSTLPGVLLLVAAGALLGAAAVALALLAAFWLVTQPYRPPAGRADSTAALVSSSAVTNSTTTTTSHSASFGPYLTRGGKYSGKVWTVPATAWSATDTLQEFPPPTEGPDAVATRWHATCGRGVLKLVAEASAVPGTPSKVRIPLRGCSVGVVCEGLRGKSAFFQKAPLLISSSSATTLLYGQTSFCLFAEHAGAKEQWLLALQWGSEGPAARSIQQVRGSYALLCSQMKAALLRLAGSAEPSRRSLLQADCDMLRLSRRGLLRGVRLGGGGSGGGTPSAGRSFRRRVSPAATAAGPTPAGSRSLSKTGAGFEPGEDEREEDEEEQQQQQLQRLPPIAELCAGLSTAKHRVAHATPRPTLEDGLPADKAPAGGVRPQLPEMPDAGNPAVQRGSCAISSDDGAAASADGAGDCAVLLSLSGPTAVAQATDPAHDAPAGLAASGGTDSVELLLLSKPAGADADAAGQAARLPQQERAKQPVVIGSSSGSFARQLPQSTRYGGHERSSPSPDSSPSLPSSPIQVGTSPPPPDAAAGPAAASSAAAAAAAPLAGRSAALHGINVMLLRVLFELLRSQSFKDRLTGVMQKWLDEVRRPAYLERAKLMQLELGSSLPVVTGLKASSCPATGTLATPQLQLSLAYQGLIRMSVETRVDLQRYATDCCSCAPGGSSNYSSPVKHAAARHSMAPHSSPRGQAAMASGSNPSSGAEPQLVNNASADAAARAACGAAAAAASSVGGAKLSRKGSPELGDDNDDSESAMHAAVAETLQREQQGQQSASPLDSPRKHRHNSSSSSYSKTKTKLLGMLNFRRAAEQVLIRAMPERLRHIPIELVVELTRLEGSVLMWMAPPPSSRLWLSFLGPPQVELSVTPVIAGRTVSYPALSSQICRWLEARLLKSLGSGLVFPAAADIALPLFADPLAAGTPPAAAAADKPGHGPAAAMQGTGGAGVSIAQAAPAPASAGWAGGRSCHQDVAIAGAGLGPFDDACLDADSPSSSLSDDSSDEFAAAGPCGSSADACPAAPAAAAAAGAAGDGGSVWLPGLELLMQQQQRAGGFSSPTSSRASSPDLEQLAAGRRRPSPAGAAGSPAGLPVSSSTSPGLAGADAGAGTAAAGGGARASIIFARSLPPKREPSSSIVGPLAPRPHACSLVFSNGISAPGSSLMGCSGQQDSAAPAPGTTWAVSAVAAAAAGAVSSEFCAVSIDAAAGLPAAGPAVDARSAASASHGRSPHSRKGKGKAAAADAAGAAAPGAAGELPRPGSSSSSKGLVSRLLFGDKKKHKTEKRLLLELEQARAHSADEISLRKSLAAAHASTLGGAAIEQQQQQQPAFSRLGMQLDPALHLGLDGTSGELTEPGGLAADGSTGSLQLLAHSYSEGLPSSDFGASDLEDSCPATPFSTASGPAVLTAFSAAASAAAGCDCDGSSGRTPQRSAASGSSLLARVTSTRRLSAAAGVGAAGAGPGSGTPLLGSVASEPWRRQTGGSSDDVCSSDAGALSDLAPPELSFASSLQSSSQCTPRDRTSDVDASLWPSMQPVQGPAAGTTPEPQQAASSGKRQGGGAGSGRQMSKVTSGLKAAMQAAATAVASASGGGAQLPGAVLGLAAEPRAGRTGSRGLAGLWQKSFGPKDHPAEEPQTSQQQQQQESGDSSDNPIRSFKDRCSDMFSGKQRSSSRSPQSSSSGRALRLPLQSPGSAAACCPMQEGNMASAKGCSAQQQQQQQAELQDGGPVTGSAAAAAAGCASGAVFQVPPMLTLPQVSVSVVAAGQPSLRSWQAQGGARGSSSAGGGAAGCSAAAGMLRPRRRSSGTAADTPRVGAAARTVAEGSAAALVNAAADGAQAGSRSSGIAEPYWPGSVAASAGSIDRAGLAAAAVGAEPAAAAVAAAARGCGAPAAACHPADCQEDELSLPEPPPLCHRRGLSWTAGLPVWVTEGAGAGASSGGSGGRGGGSRQLAGTSTVAAAAIERQLEQELDSGQAKGLDALHTATGASVGAAAGGGSGGSQSSRGDCAPPPPPAGSHHQRSLSAQLFRMRF